MECKDGKRRCAWVNPANELYIKYHDTEWGVPVSDDGKLFEMLVLESFQAGLSWECILSKREAFRQAFDGFDAKKIKDYDSGKIESLMQNRKIVRSRRKIMNTVVNAQVFLRICVRFGGFLNYLHSFAHVGKIYEKGLAKSELSDALADDLKKQGMKGLGSITVYSYLQAVGIIYSHESGCFLEHIDDASH